jgi:exonuclease SbcC
MKILAIRIKNLASLEGSTEIDFTAEPLCSAGIFAITGTTGAGKSTILDALCLALYNNTPRYINAKEQGIDLHDVLGHKIKQGDVRAILRDGTSDGYAQVDFAGIDGQHFRATWSVRRSRNKVDGSLQTSTNVLTNITTGTDYPAKSIETLNEIARVVGLNFEQFTRSVLLAQGDFTAFMKANKDEKSSLLEKLTGTHIYSEISRKVYENFRNEEQILNNLKLTVEGIQTLSEEEITNLNSESSLLQAQIERLEKDLLAVEKNIQWHEQYIQMLNALTDAETTFEAAKQRQKEVQHRRDYLFLAEQAQQVRSWSDTLQLALAQRSNKLKVVEEVNKNIEKLQQEDRDCTEKGGVIGKDLTIKSSEFQAAIPLFNEAKRLDTVIGEKTRQLEGLRHERQLAENKRIHQEKTIDQTTTGLKKLEDEIMHLQEWRRNHQNRQAIADNSELILSKLEDAVQHSRKQKTLETEISDINKSLSENDLQAKTVFDGITIAEREVNNSRTEFEKLSKELLLIPIEKLNLDKDAADSEIQELISALGHWKQLYTNRQNLERLQADLTTQEKDLTEKDSQLKEISKDLISLESKRDTSQHLYKQSQLAAAENVEDLRAGLEPNQPCPVCGSTSHPYNSESAVFHKVLGNLEKAMKVAEDQYMNTYGRQKALEQDCSALRNAISKLNTEIPALSQSLLTLQTDWNNYKIAEKLGSSTPDLRTELLEQHLREVRDRQSALQNAIQEHTKLRSRIDSNRAQLEKHTEYRDVLRQQLQDVGRNIALNKEKLAAKTSEYLQASEALNHITDLLSTYFTNTDWIDKWRDNPITFAERVQELTNSWRDSEKQLEENLQRQKLIRASLEAMLITTKEISVDLDRKSAIVRSHEQELEYTLLQRKKLFDGQSVDEIERHMQLEIKALQNQLKEQETKQKNITVDCAGEIAKRKALIEELETVDNTISKADNHIRRWIIDFNAQHQASVDRPLLDSLLALTPAWQKEENEFLQEIDQAVTKAVSIFSERRDYVEKHKKSRTSEKEIDQLANEKVNLKKDLDVTKVRINEIDFRLRQNESSMAKIGDIMKQINEQKLIKDNWGSLNELIGSADGKKFRQVAQEYTLDVLLSYANVHLGMLTNRYRIERIPSTLGLQVVDQDMGDEVRTVYSLSGGESFLVSLALALGLASLSTTRMQVESLFIDEGFGSLDPATLNIAMDALERLHNQGRKVGVISHVQEMTERIPVQIQVSKLSSGRSKVQVV